ncbi:hypothetical protein BDW59DRAFT_166075 [Aspergillus cavernicola]|uniref:HAD-like domain-containing protein n=1 Tax=Aspergillus cavernicola TaxID=176166 RepID=A0ABR4HNH3_9EURO
MPLRSSLRTTLKDFLTIRYTPSSPTLPPQASKYKLVIINFGGTLFETDDANVQELLPQLNTTPIPHLGAMDLLIGLQQRGIPVVISSSNNNNTTNRAIPVIFEAMDRFRLSEYVRGDLIVGDLHGDDAREYTEVILPRLKNIYGEEWTQKSGEVLVVGGTGTDSPCN